MVRNKRVAPAVPAAVAATAPGEGTGQTVSRTPPRRAHNPRKGPAPTPPGVSPAPSPTPRAAASPSPRLARTPVPAPRRLSLVPTPTSVKQRAPPPPVPVSRSVSQPATPATPPVLTAQTKLRDSSSPVLWTPASPVEPAPASPTTVSSQSVPSSPSPPKELVSPLTKSEEPPLPPPPPTKSASTLESPKESLSSPRTPEQPVSPSESPKESLTLPEPLEKSDSPLRLAKKPIPPVESPKESVTSPQPSKESPSPLESPRKAGQSPESPKDSVPAPELPKEPVSPLKPFTGAVLLAESLEEPVSIATPLDKSSPPPKLLKEPVSVLTSPKEITSPPTTAKDPTSPSCKPENTPTSPTPAEQPVLSPPASAPDTPAAGETPAAPAVLQVLTVRVPRSDQPVNSMPASVTQKPPGVVSEAPSPALPSSSYYFGEFEHHLTAAGGVSDVTDGGSQVSEDSSTDVGVCMDDSASDISQDSLVTSDSAVSSPAVRHLSLRSTTNSESSTPPPQPPRSSSPRRPLTLLSTSSSALRTSSPAPPTSPSVLQQTYSERYAAMARPVRAPLLTVPEHGYHFHIHEMRDSAEERAAEEAGEQHEDGFAGVRDFFVPPDATIRSGRGTVRGVKNRVRAGIATFLQDNTKTKSYKEREQGRIVVYITTMGIVRGTYQKCLRVRQILRTLMVRFDERDLFLNTALQAELKERMETEQVLLPQVFVEGQLLGGAETVERLNESGELRRMLKPYKTTTPTSSCGKCGGFKMLPCTACNGSKKSCHRNYFTAEWVILRCCACDESGLVMCDLCVS